MIKDFVLLLKNKFLFFLIVFISTIILINIFQSKLTTNIVQITDVIDSVNKPKCTDDNNDNKNVNKPGDSNSNNKRDKLKYVKTRDFIRYDCKNITRVGGQPQFVKNAPDRMFRIDGAWFVCLDNGLFPKPDSCIVFSFGINYDYSFDEEMIKLYSCNVHSFDPIVEAGPFNQVRLSNPSLANAPTLKVNDKWTFYKLGITDQSTSSLDALKLGDKLDFGSFLKLTNLENKVIDIVKMDVEGEEKQFIQSLDMNYACKYIKQFVLETHANFKFDELVKLEQCFYLYYRHTRFFIGDIYGQPTGGLSEFQNPNGYHLDLKRFGNEINLADFMFINGEMYFVNENFFNL